MIMNKNKKNTYKSRINQESAHRSRHQFRKEKLVWPICEKINDGPDLWPCGNRSRLKPLKTSTLQNNFVVVPIADSARRRDLSAGLRRPKSTRACTRS